MGIGSRLAHAWNSFFTEDDVPRPFSYQMGGMASATRPDRPRLRINSERTIISSIYTRMAIDVAGVRIEHVRVNENGQYLETINSGLNQCLNVEANLDQAGRHFRQDIPMSMFSEGCIAIVPVDTTLNPMDTGGWDIKSMRVGTIVDWRPEEVMVRAYNQKNGKYEEILLPKKIVGIVENPFFAVMNEANSTLQRLVHKLSLLDNIDEISSQGKLDIIIQLPYVVKSETRKNQAEARTKQIQEQLKDSTYGIAYTDGTEKITQLNRSVENNLLEQVKYLKEELYNELGLTPAIMNGTADDVVMLNYMNRTIEPIMDAIVEAMARSFLTKTARSQLQTIMYFQNPFKLIPISKLGEVTDVLSRNQIVTPNEIRPVIGLKPSKEPQADQLINSNMPLDKQVTSGGEDVATPPDPVATTKTSSTQKVSVTASTDPADIAEAKLNQQMAELGLS